MIDAEVLRDCTCSPTLLIKQCESALDLETNKGDQAFHLLVEQFGLVLRDALQKEEVDFVAFCLVASYTKASESVRHGDGIAFMLKKLARDLIESSDVLLVAIRDQGAHGKALARDATSAEGSWRVVM